MAVNNNMIYTRICVDCGKVMCFQSLYQNTANSRRLRGESFESEMLNVYKTKRDYVNETFGLK